GHLRRLAVEQRRRTGTRHELAQAVRLAAMPISFSALATSGARTASAIARGNTAITVGLLISRKRLLPNVVSANASASRSSGSGQVGRHAQSFRALGDADGQDLLFAAEVRTKLALRCTRPRCDLERGSLGEALLHERRKGCLQEALPHRDFPGLIRARLHNRFNRHLATST